MADQAPMAEGGGGFAAMPTWQKVALGAAAVGGAYLLYRRYQSSQASASSGTTDTSTASPQIDPATGNLINPLTGQDYVTSAPAQPTDNSQWLLSAEQAAQHLGYAPGLVDQALNNFLNGNQLTNQQAGVINTLLGKIGYPPIQVPFLNPLGNTGQGTTPPKPTKKATKGFQWELVNNVWRQVRFANQDVAKKATPPVVKRTTTIPSIPIFEGGTQNHSTSVALQQTASTIRPHVSAVASRPLPVVSPPHVTGTPMLGAGVSFGPNPPRGNTGGRLPTPTRGVIPVAKNPITTSPLGRLFTKKVA